MNPGPLDGTDQRWPGPSSPRASSCLGAQLAISVNNCPPPRDPRSRMTSFKRTQRKDVQKRPTVSGIGGSTRRVSALAGV